MFVLMGTFLEKSGVTGDLFRAMYIIGGKLRGGLAIQTLIVAVILYAVGTGPIKGFAVTLSVGIITSMFTAIMGTRALVNVVYGGRRVQRLSIGRVRMKADAKTEGATA